MRLHRFFIDTTLHGDTIRLSSQALLHQWQHVLKLKTGEHVILFDGTGTECLSTLTELREDEAVLSVERRSAGVLPRRELWLFVGLPKKDKLEWIAEKATEVGVSHIVPVLADRSEKKGMNEARLRKIVVEAAEQSGRATLMSLHGAFSLKEAIREHPHLSFIACVPGGGELSVVPADKKIAALIGPEGGWSERELAFFAENNIPTVSLGDTTLRTETAAIAAAVRLLS